MMRPRRSERPEYRDLGLALVLLLAICGVSGGLAAVRLGLFTVEVKVGLGPRMDRAQVALVESQQRTAERAVDSAIGHIPPARTIAMAAPTPLVGVAEGSEATAATQTTPVAEAPGAPVKPATPARRSRALTATPAKSGQIPDCAATAEAANADPTAGEIRGTTGLPDEVVYFKHTNKSAMGCRTDARPVLAPASRTR